MEIYVIALADNLSQKIVADTYKSLESKNINFNKFEVINGYEVKNKDILNKYNKKNKIIPKKLLKPGQSGCFASHMELIRKCSNSDKNYLILEQDAVLMDNFDLNFLNKCSDNCKDVILLDPYNPYKKEYNQNVKKDITLHRLQLIDNLKKNIESLKKYKKKLKKEKKLTPKRRQKIQTNLISLTNKLKDKEKNKLFYNYHYKHKYFRSKGAYCYIISPEGAKKILKHIKHQLVPLDHIFVRWKNINVKTTTRTIFRINKKYKAGVYSSTAKDYELLNKQ